MRQQNEKTGVHSAIAHETSTKYIYKKMVFIRYAREKIHVSFFGLVLGESEDVRDKQNTQRERERAMMPNPN